MIVSDAHRIVFIHIPKCAGTTVRRQLEALDDTGRRFANHDGQHPVLGAIDTAHIPLAVLRQHYPVEYAKVKEYASFALVRNPFERFPSSFTQHLKVCGKGPIKSLPESQIRLEVERVIRFLQGPAGTGEGLPREYIHFQRQRDFVFDDGQQVVQHIYDTSRVEALVEHVFSLAGRSAAHSFESGERHGQSFVYRNEVWRKAMERARRPARALLPTSVRKVAKSLVGSLYEVPRDKRHAPLFSSPPVQEFVKSYYADDIDLVESVTGRRPGAG
jgi:hypothetical protein